MEKVNEFPQALFRASWLLVGGDLAVAAANWLIVGLPVPAGLGFALFVYIYGKKRGTAGLGFISAWSALMAGLVMTGACGLALVLPERLVASAFHNYQTITIWHLMTSVILPVVAAIWFYWRSRGACLEMGSRAPVARFGWVGFFVGALFGALMIMQMSRGLRDPVVLNRVLATEPPGTDALVLSSKRSAGYLIFMVILFDDDCIRTRIVEEGRR